MAENRKGYIDIANIAACFLVLWDHVNGTWHSFEHSFSWVISTGIHVLVNPGVPIFAMITGALLIDYRKKYSTKTYIKKRVISTVIPFLIWSIVYAGFRMITGSYHWEGIRDLLSGIMNSKFNGIFWFFFPLFGSYLMIPIISSIEENNRRKIYKYSIFLYIVFGQLMPTLFSFLKIEYNSYLKFSDTFGFLFYVICGYYIDKFYIRKIKRIIIYLGGLGCFVFNIVDCVYHSFKNDAITRCFAGCFSFTYCVTAVAVFLFIKYSCSIEKIYKTSLLGIRDLTFGIYMIQIIVLYYIQRIEWVVTNSIWYIIFGVFPVFIICLLITAILRKIPCFKYIL